METQPVTCLIVEDHPLTAHGMAAVLAAARPQYRITVCHTVADAQRFLSTCSPEATGIVLLDLTLKDGAGWDVLITIKKHRLSLKSIVISASCTNTDVDTAKMHGARGFISKSQDHALFIQAIKIVETGGECFITGDDMVTFGETPFARITAALPTKRKQILDLILAGWSDKEIARILCRSHGHISNVASQLYDYYSVKKREHLMMAAHAAGYKPATELHTPSSTTM